MIKKLFKIQQEKTGAQQRQLVLWIAALAIGALFGLLGIRSLNELMSFIATIYTRLFQLLAVPTITLAVITTLAFFGQQKDTGRIFKHAVVYTLLTTFTAAAVGLLLFNLIQPGTLPADMVRKGLFSVPKNLTHLSPQFRNPTKSLSPL